MKTGMPWGCPICVIPYSLFLIPHSYGKEYVYVNS